MNKACLSLFFLLLLFAAEKQEHPNPTAHLLLGELPVVVQVHLLEGLMRPGPVPDLQHFDDEGQRAVRRDLS